MKKFQNDIDHLIGKLMVLTFDRKQYPVTINGIFNAGYDDFFISSDIEQELYQTTIEDKPYSLRNNVKVFNEVVSFFIIIGIFISVILLVKLTNSRYREV